MHFLMFVRVVVRCGRMANSLDGVRVNYLSADRRVLYHRERQEGNNHAWSSFVLLGF